MATLIDAKDNNFIGERNKIHQTRYFKCDGYRPVNIATYHWLFIAADFMKQ